jgi:hypothetical protein
MNLFSSLISVKKKDQESTKRSVNQQTEMLIEIINESIEIAKVSPNLEVKKARLDYAMKKVIDLIALVNRYPFIASKRLAPLYASIREVRNDIKSMESVMARFGNKEVA